MDIFNIHLYSASIQNAPQNQSHHLSQIGSKSIPQCPKIDPKLNLKSIQNGIWDHLGPTWLPREIFDGLFWAPYLKPKIVPNSIPKSKHFQAPPRNLFSKFLSALGGAWGQDGRQTLQLRGKMLPGFQLGPKIATTP